MSKDTEKADKEVPKEIPVKMENKKMPVKARTMTTKIMMVVIAGILCAVLAITFTIIHISQYFYRNIW